LEKAQELTQKNALGSCALLLLFFSDGKPSDVCNGVGSVTRMSNVDKKAATAVISLDQPAMHNVDAER